MSAIAEAGKTIKESYEALLNGSKEKGLTISHKTDASDALTGVVTVSISGKSADVDASYKKALPNDAIGISHPQRAHIHSLSVEVKPHGKEGDDQKIITIQHVVTAY